VCFTPNRLEIGERITWLQRAEGCLISLNGKGDVSKERMADLLKFKDYYLIILQLKDLLKDD
jgi:hypothetical protein